MQSQQIFNDNLKKRSERLEARVSRELKSLLQEAAELEGNSLSDFITQTAREKANQIIREHKILKLSAEESREFIKAILNPPKPNRELRKTFLEYKKAVISR